MCQNDPSTIVHLNSTIGICFWALIHHHVFLLALQANQFGQSSVQNLRPLVGKQLAVQISRSVQEKVRACRHRILDFTHLAQFLLNSSPLPVCRCHLQLSSDILSIRWAYISESAVKKKQFDENNGLCVSVEWYFLSCRRRANKPDRRLQTLWFVQAQLFGWDTGDVRNCNSLPSSQLVLWCQCGVSGP